MKDNFKIEVISPEKIIFSDDIKVAKIPLVGFILISIFASKNTAFLYFRIGTQIVPTSVLGLKVSHL